MSRLSQVLLLDPPHELRFQGPYKTDVTSHLELSNPTEHPVAFKVKTTAPKRYCVRPNSGIIEPKQSMRLLVILRSFDKDQSTEQLRDKFMVQSIMCEDGVTWSEDIFKGASPDRLMDSKIRCVFDPPATNESKPEESKVIEEKQVVKEVPGDYVSAVETITQLRDEISRLNREKLDLQEESAKLRKRVAVASSAMEQPVTAAAPQQQRFNAVENKPPGVNLTMEILAVAFLVTFFVALFIGKTVL